MTNSYQELISIEKIVEAAKEKGIDFGKGDPYNRLRYYTKIGWLPHMIRKKDENGNTRGHYPIEAIERLVLIESLKNSGTPNGEISKKLKVKSRVNTLLDILKTKETREQAIKYLSFALLLLILLNETGIITLGKSKTNTIAVQNQQNMLNKQIYDNGTAFVPKNQNKIVIQTRAISPNSKVNVTFTQDYFPATRYWIKNTENSNGFILELDAPVFENAEFNWWVTD